MELQNVWGVTDNGFVRLYESEKKAREEYLAIVETIKNNTYFHPNAHRNVEFVLQVEDYDTHYVIYKAETIFGDYEEYRQVWLAKLKIN